MLPERVEVGSGVAEGASPVALARVVTDGDRAAERVAGKAVPLAPVAREAVAAPGPRETVPPPACAEGLALGLTARGVAVETAAVPVPCTVGLPLAEAVAVCAAGVAVARSGVEVSAREALGGLVPEAERVLLPAPEKEAVLLPPAREALAVAEVEGLGELP